jgi:hypothetical protein
LAFERVIQNFCVSSYCLSDGDNADGDSRVLHQDSDSESLLRRKKFPKKKMFDEKFIGPVKNSRPLSRMHARA